MRVSWASRNWSTEQSSLLSKWRPLSSMFILKKTSWISHIYIPELGAFSLGNFTEEQLLCWHHVLFFFLPQRVKCFHLTLSSASSSLTPTNFMSSFRDSIYLLWPSPCLAALFPTSFYIYRQIYDHFYCPELNGNHLDIQTFTIIMWLCLLPSA